MADKKLAVLLSGRGSNFVAIADNIARGRLSGCRINVVISDKMSAGGLDEARQRGIDTLVFPRKNYDTKQAWEGAMIAAIEDRSIDYIILAGFMRILGDAFVESFPQRILNIHPSLLPSFIGLDAQRQALEYGVRYSGCTVHFVTSDLDAGPIIVQKVVPVHSDDDEESLSRRILEQEHIAYSEAIDLIVNRGFIIQGRRVELQ
ncbi:phosphoribosylglycinamide formyltransferase [Desulfurispira natronophila]|uniref:Phosphoribosylglycinamide formyltransferase n=1 Tax=Desulfurispira natronophila TaxID=682562 RepID=A0A7W7Y4V9_9BACT|nr:phosphoribosylglycinamide formyltransferase [Desulfurispira natronophila]MBB5022135.1 phosphoribosylglycinamide formyltransferase-1 [Desulfurispira natronophila]